MKSLVKSSSLKKKSTFLKGKSRSSKKALDKLERKSSSTLHKLEALQNTCKTPEQNLVPLNLKLKKGRKMKFEQAVEIILNHEGGAVNHAQDPGGLTKYGISKRSYPNIDILSLDIEGAKKIYKDDFWDLLQLELFPPSMRLIVFDCAINQGPGAAVGLLQAALGVKVDGVLGPVTFEKMAQANVQKLLKTYARLRLNRYIDNPKFAYFGEGWVRRLFDVALESMTING